VQDERNTLSGVDVCVLERNRVVLNTVEFHDIYIIDQRPKML
jgi:hypothetical protein